MLPPRLQPSLLLLCLSALAGPAVLPATATATCRAFPGQGWDTATPASVGLDAAKLDEFRAAAGSGPGVVIKDGLLVYSWGDQSFRPGWASSSKALFSTLLFFAIQEGLVGSVDDRIADLGWPLTQADETMTFRHLANMVSGYSLPEGPGTRWAYNDYGVTLFKRSVIEDGFGVNAADPLAVTDLIDDPAHLGPLRFEDGGLVLVWGNPPGTPAVNMTARDYARVGLLWLNRGHWDGTQLLDPDFFDQYAQPLVPAELLRTAGGGPDDYLNIGSDGGTNDQTGLGPGIFGFMWWFNPGRSTWPDAPADTFQANGRWNHATVTMIPSLGLVAAWGGGVDADPELFAGPMNAILEPLVNSVTPRCSDGLDNDGDGLVDFGEDPGCSDPLDALETSALACDDGLDNDGDGLCDQADPGCASPLYPREDPDCDDGLDNDGDGRIDWDGAGVALPDPGCFGGADNSETAGKASCGLGSGLEAAGWSLLLGLALVLRRRFRSTES